MKKFGTFSGVFIPSYEAILGAVLFLLLPFLSAAMGLGNMLLILLIAHSATIATSFSISDCTSNLVRISSGGMYAVSKQSLGSAFGGSIGIQLYLAQTLSIGFYVIGFAASLQAILLEIPAIASVISSGNLLRLIAIVIALFGFSLALIGADFIVKIQKLIFVVLSISILALLLSPLIFPHSSIWSGSINFEGNGVGRTIGFWAAFAMFFPAVTGIDAGIGMSGQLKDPRKSLSKGTFLAIAITFLIYASLTFVFSLIHDGIPILGGLKPASALHIFSWQPVMRVLILLGILFATGSSTLSYFLTAPRTAQALAHDNLLPKFLNFLGRDFRKDGNEPRFAILLTLVIFIPLIFAGDIQVASTVVGISFLVVYGWVNLAAFFERISGNPSFRPRSKGHWIISLYGFGICILGIILFNPWIGIIVLVFQITIFLLLLRFKSGNKLEGVWWGVLFKIMQWNFSRLSTIVQGSKNWRPITCLFAYEDNPKILNPIIAMSEQIGLHKGITLVNILSEPSTTRRLDEVARTSDTIPAHIPHRVVKIGHRESAELSILSIVQSAVPGNLKTNTVLFPVDSRINLLRMVEQLIELGKHVLLFRPQDIEKANSTEQEELTTQGRIDIYWKDERNGTLMALLAYIITQSETESWEGITPSDLSIRVLCKLQSDENENRTRSTLREIMDKARIDGEIHIIEPDDRSIEETVCEESQTAFLVLQGIPGEFKTGSSKSFLLDKQFIERFKIYKYMPNMLFVKASHTINLEE